MTDRNWSKVVDAEVAAIQRDYGVPDERMEQLMRAMILAERTIAGERPGREPPQQANQPMMGLPCALGERPSE